MDLEALAVMRAEEQMVSRVWRIKEPDCHHAKPCSACGVGTYRRSGLCKRCERLEKLPSNVSDAFLWRCVEELRRRIQARAEILETLAKESRCA
jgi:hypothetical protein